MHEVASNPTNLARPDRRDTGAGFRQNPRKHIIYGPIHSRRLGCDLGINPLDERQKWCTFNCRYCQDGRSRHNELHAPENYPLPSRAEIIEALAERLQELRHKGQSLDAISFCGNGEPTLHPQFPQLVEDVLMLGRSIFPSAAVGAFSNGTTLRQPEIFESLVKLDGRYIKLDAGTEETFRALDQAHESVSLREIVDGLTALAGKTPVTVQTMFVQGAIDNSAPAEVAHWIEHLRCIRPRCVHIYSLDRRPRDRSLARVNQEVLESIARKLRSSTGLEIRVF